MVCWSVSQIIGCVGVFTCSVGLFYNVPINLFYLFIIYYSDNYKKCAPLKCEITEDLPASKVQKDSKTSLLEGKKSSYDTLSTGNALYHDQKKIG